MTKKHDIIWLDKVDSTNEEALRRLPYIDNLSVLSATEQTEGRGQRGNSWSSKPGENLTFSIVLKFSDNNTVNTSGLPSLKAYDQFILNAVTSLSVVDFLSIHGIKATVKWPNDIYVSDKKICGILIENSIKDRNISRSVIGIGLNINQTTFDIKLPNPISMTQCTSRIYPPESLLEEFMDVFTEYYKIYLQNTTAHSELKNRYKTSLWRMGVPSGFKDMKSDREFIGTIRGLSDIGLLVIEDTEKGELKEFAFKDISYIL